MQLEKALRYSIIAGIFLLPLTVLIVIDGLFFPYITGKNFFFRVIVEIVVALWAALALFNAAYRPRVTALVSSVVVFIGVVALADIAGVYPFKSIWSNYERMEGLITLLHLLAYFIVAGTVLATEKLWLWFWRASVAVSAAVSVNAIGQLLLTEKGRLDATLGNPIYLAMYVLFHIFVMCIMLARRGASPRRNTFEYIVYALIIPLHLFVLYFTATRGAGIGLILGAIVTSAGIAFSMRHHTKVRTAAITVLVAVLVLVGSFYAARGSAFLQETPVLKRFATISLTEGTVYARTLVWGIAWEGIKERPLLGWGQANFNFVFNKYYDPRMYDQEQWFDRTHNVIFDWAIAAGLLGLLAYIAIYLALLWTLYRTEQFTLTQKWLFVGLLVGYGFSLLTVFDNIVSYVLFFSILAWVYATATDVWHIPSGRQRIPEIYTPSVRVALVVGAGVLAVGLVWAINAGAYTKNTTLLRGLASAATAEARAQQGNAERAPALSEQALTLVQEAETIPSYGTQEVREQFVEAARQMAGATWLSESERQAWYTSAQAAIERQIERVPADARPWALLSNLHTSFKNYDAARDAQREALERTPNKPSVLVGLAASSINMERYDEAVPYAQTAFELVPGYDEGRVIYATALLLNGQTEEGLALIQEKPEVADDARLIPILVQHGRHDTARAVWRIVVAHRPQDPNAYFTLVAAYAQQRDETRAYAELNRLVAEVPQLQQMAAQIRTELDQYFSR